MFYKGWVPTVNGRLSFKLIGETRYPREPEYVNSWDGAHQYVAAVQLRQLSDVLFEPILGPLLGYSGEFECVLCGRARRANSSPDSKLIGKAYLFRRSVFRTSGAKASFATAMTLMREFYPGTANPQLKLAYLDLTETLAGKCDLSVDVVLNRDGVISLHDVKWNNFTLERNTVSHSDQIDFDFEHGVADQVYFFIRDLTHQHQHHGNDADTIITTHRISKPADMTWCLEVMYSLYHHIITSKRRENPAEHVRALGILAYLQSFKNIAKRRAEKSKSNLLLPDFDDAASKESIKATKDYIDLRLNEQKKNSDNQKAFLLWFVATAFTVVNFTVGFADKTTVPNENVAAVANFLKENAYALPVLAIAAIVYSLSNLILKPRYDFKRDVVRLSFAGRNPTVFIAFALGALMLAGGVWYWRALLAI